MAAHRILLAETAGYCMGVRRAMEIALRAAEAAPPPVRTLGPLIHNRAAVDRLAARGVEEAPEEAVPAAGSVILRAHGVAPAVRERLEAAGARIVDATCPHVLAGQRRVAEAAAAGKGVVIAGDRDHPEVRGLAGHAAGRPVAVLATVEEARRLVVPEPFVLVAQTTFHRELFRLIADALRARFPRCEVFDTVCEATARRQDEARRLAAEADVLVVVGGRHSANTRRLAAVGEEAGARVVHVESAAELDPAALAEADTIALTAGASTPPEAIAAVLARLEALP